MDRLRICKLRVSGVGKPDVELTFGPGLTLLTGLSNTGKSQVLECIDYGLAAGAAPKEIPEAKGYDQIALELEHDGSSYTIERRLQDPENATFFSGRLEDWDGQAGDPIKVAISPKDPHGTLSGRLLELSCFDPGTPVVRNQRGQQQALSFRTVAPLVVIKEPDVISDGSPVLPTQQTQQTAARSVFRILLTGEAPTQDITSLKDAHELHAQATQRVEVLESMIEALREEITDAEADRGRLEQELARIDQELAEVSETVAQSGKAVRQLMTVRNQELAAANRARVELLSSQELQARFKLLSEHYSSDVSRLEFVLEGGHFFQQIAASHCPRCGQSLEPDAICHPESADFEQIERASRAEIKKLLPRMTDLTTALSDAERDGQRARAGLERSRERAQRLDIEITQVANPTAASARQRVRNVTKRRREVEEQLLRFRELDRYIAAREQAAQEAKKKLERYRPELDTAALGKLSAEIKSLLVEWKFPVRSDLHFSIDTDDIVIDSKDRAANGKGVRAVTHAAFTIGLMRHCLNADTPHPGFVVIDTPLTHFKGITDGIDDPEMTRDLHAAFLYSLASANDGGQAIIVENVEPPAMIRDLATVHEFTGPEGAGRRGFYPVI